MEQTIHEISLQIIGKILSEDKYLMNIKIKDGVRKISTKQIRKIVSQIIHQREEEISGSFLSLIDADIEDTLLTMGYEVAKNKYSNHQTAKTMFYIVPKKSYIGDVERLMKTINTQYIERMNRKKGRAVKNEEEK